MRSKVVTVWPLIWGVSPAICTLNTAWPKAGGLVTATPAVIALSACAAVGNCQVGGAAYFVLEDVDALCREIARRGIAPAEPPSETEWRAREMTVVDPDGNRLRFGTPAADATA